MHELVPLAAIATITSGKRPPTVSKERTASSSVPVVGGGGTSGFTNEALYQVPVLVTGRVGTLGKLFSLSEPCWPSDNALVIRPRTLGTDAKFLRYALQLTIGEAASMNRGAANPLITQTDLGRLLLPHPSKERQVAIGSALGSLDDKIELNRRMNETLEAMAQAIFRDWLVDFGPTRRKLEGATDPVTIMGGLVTDPTRAQELADLFPATLGDDGLPEGWTHEPLLDQANWVNGAAYKNMHFSDAPDALPVVKIAELKSGVTTTTKRTATDLGAKYRIASGELLFSWSGNPDTSIDAFVWTGEDAWLNQHIFAVRENGRRSVSSLYVLLKYLKPTFAELARNKQTTGLGHVTKEDMKRLPVTVPSPEIELAFETITAPFFELIVANLRESQTLAAMRELLLPKLMSGEIRLGDANDFVEAAQ